MKSVNDILELPRQEILDSLKEVASGCDLQKDDFNWHGLAEVAGTKTHLATEKAIALEWAKISLFCYEFLIENADGPVESFTESAMLLRTSLICKYGHASKDDILDVSIIESWFDNNLKFSIAEIKSYLKVPFGKDDLPLMKELRKLKNKLNIIELLQKSNSTSSPEKYNGFLELKKQLP